MVKSALEPQWEARFEGESYGFRPGRSTHDAMSRIFQSINKGEYFILDADISKCFDQINHEYLLSKIDCPSTMKAQIKQWLKAGVMDNGIFNATETGTPQGGVISPLLANIALDGMMSLVRSLFPKKTSNNKNYATVIRYADDFVVISPQLEVIQQCQVVIEEWLKPIGLELKPAKTRLCHTLREIEVNGENIPPGFDFLGWNFRQYPVGKHHAGKSGGAGKSSKTLEFKTFIKPSKKAIKAHADKVKEVIKTHKTAPQYALIKRLNPVIRGWCNYHSKVVSNWSTRKGTSFDVPNKVAFLLKKQKGKCTFCGQYFTPEDIAEIDHIIPTSLGGKDEYKNLQLLHRHCHDIKTSTDGSYNSKEDGWYASIVIEDASVPSPLSLDTVKSAVGIDVGLKEFLVDSEGDAVPIQQYYRKAQSKLARAQRELSRKVKGSANYQKLAHKIACLHQFVARVRKEFHYQVAHKLCEKYDLIGLEDINIKGLAKTRLAKSILDAAWGQFSQILEAVAVKRGNWIVKVNPYGTSQRCSGCGKNVPKALSVRTHECPHCGTVLDRDHNAAINIKNLALNAVGLTVSACGSKRGYSACEAGIFICEEKKLTLYR